MGDSLPREVLIAEVECLRKELKLAKEEIESLNKIINAYKSIAFGQTQEEVEKNDI